MYRFLIAHNILPLYASCTQQITPFTRCVKSALAALILSCWMGTAMASAQTSSSSPFTLMVYGDSLVAGYGLPPHQSFPSQLEQYLRTAGLQADVVNAGVSGDTTQGGRNRLAWTLAEKPDGLILVLGGNDMLRGLDPQAAYDNLDAMLEVLTSQQIPVLLCGMLASANLGVEYQQAFDSIYPRLAAKYEVSYYPFFLEGVALNPTFNQPDGIHPNAAGVAHIIENMSPYLDSFIPQLTQAE